MKENGAITTEKSTDVVRDAAAFGIVGAHVGTLFAPMRGSLHKLAHSIINQQLTKGLT